MTQYIPLPTDGIAGLLTSDQSDSLRSMWREFQKLLDEAPEEGTETDTKLKRSATTNSSASGSSKEPKGTPKDDKAKDAARLSQDLKAAREGLEKYGRRRFERTFWKFVQGDNPDDQMLRFLRARKWQLTPAVAMLLACLKWRIESGVENLFEEGEEGLAKLGKGGLIHVREGKTFLHGTDRDGRVVIYIHARLHHGSDQDPKELEAFIMHHMETCRNFFASPRMKTTLVFNMTGFGLGNMDWRIVLFLVKCLESYFPESLNCILIHNAPWVFQGIWKILAPLLDPVVRAKVQMTKNLDDLLVHIDKRHLLKELGGESDWTWNYEEFVPGENDLLSDTAGREKRLKERERLLKVFERINQRWLESREGEQKYEKARWWCIYKMRVQWFDLERFIRGRTVYDRQGNLVGNGLSTFHYPNVGGEQEGEWEVRGWEQSKENLETKIKALERELNQEGFDWNAVDPDGEEIMSEEDFELVNTGGSSKSGSSRG
ncbi:CRAL/TRIO domain-containing protein [Atractiella rhizophila]|nr:CRAL/TRIO domain-containing protein [Atractiella rhizophila]